MLRIVNLSQPIRRLVVTRSMFVFALMVLLSWSAFLEHPRTHASNDASPNSSEGTWTNTGDLNVARFLHSATTLSNGTVLVAGGIGGNGNLNKAEVYDPATGPATGSWTTTGDLNVAREGHTATVLANCKVLVAGGIGSNGALNKAELYDPATGPATGSWTTTGDLNVARWGHTATLLANGKVLVVGGIGSNGTILNKAEVYDPATGTWTTTGDLNVARRSHTATLLANGTVLVAGGIGGNGNVNKTEVYDPATGPATGSWTTTGDLNFARSRHTATLLANGRVLVAGGQGSSPTLCFQTCNKAEVYNPGLGPATGSWTITGDLNFARFEHTATSLSNGKVLVAGGQGSTGTLKSTELYDPATAPATGSWTTTGDLNFPHWLHTATLLPNGKVLVAGGFSSGILNKAELYDPEITLAQRAAARAQTLLGLPYGLGGKGFDYLLGPNGTWVDSCAINNGFKNRATECQQPALSQTSCGGYDYYGCNSDRTDEVNQGMCDGKLHRDWGIDCSGLVMWSYDTAAGATRFQDNNFIYYPNAQGQYLHNVLPTDLAFADLQPGDLLFFNYDHACDSTIAENTTDLATCIKTKVDHVVMYVGGDSAVEAYSRKFGVIPSSKATRSTMDPKASTICSASHVCVTNFQPCNPDPQHDTKPCFAGYRRPQHAPVGMKAGTGSPISLILTDPDGLTISADTLSLTNREVLREVADQLYYIVDSDFDDTVISPTLKMGDYLIRVVAKPNALPTDTYNLTVEAAGTSLTLAQNTPIVDIPTLGYGIESTGNTITPFIPIAIDIMPAGFPNTINPNKQGKIPIAILSNANFNALSEVDTRSLKFGQTGHELSLAFCNSGGEDVNGDGLRDLVCSFYAQKTGFKAGDTKGILVGFTIGGRLIRGVDSVRIVF